MADEHLTEFSQGKGGGRVFKGSMSLLQRNSQSMDLGHTDGMRVLEKMREEPGLHEKIFKMFS